MPATEQTWRNQKLMHRIFAASCLVLLAATVGMFLADHNREWKQYQRKFRDIEIVSTNWRQWQYETDMATQQLAELQAELLQARSRAVDRNELTRFEDEMKADAERRKVGTPSLTAVESNVDRLDKLAEEAGRLRREADAAFSKSQQAGVNALEKSSLRDQAAAALASAKDQAQAREDLDAKTQAAGEAEEAAKEQAQLAAEAEEQARQAEQAAGDVRDVVVRQLEAIIAAARSREDIALRSRKFKSAEVDAARANLGIDVRDDKTKEQRDRSQAAIDDLVGEPDGAGLVELTLQYERAKGHRLELQKILKQITEEVDLAKKAVLDQQAELERLKSATLQRRSTYFTGSFPWLGKKWLELPILDAFNSPLKIENLWDEDNRIDYNFGKVRRYDRCTTCHQAMEKTMPGSAVEPAYVQEHELDYVLGTPNEGSLPVGPDGEAKELTVYDLLSVYGLQLAGHNEYLLNKSDATISFVQPYLRDAQAKPARLSIAASAFPLKSAGKLDLRGNLGAAEVALEQGQTPEQVVSSINSSASKTGVSARESAGGVEMYSANRGDPEVGRKTFVIVNDSGPLKGHLSETHARGTDAPSTLAAQAILTPKGGTKMVRGDVLRQLATQHSTQAEITVGAEAFPLQDDLTLRITGLLGAQRFSFAQGTTLDDITQVFRQATNLTGIIPHESDGMLRLKSREYGSEAFVDVAVINGDHFSSQLSATRDVGLDVSKRPMARQGLRVGDVIVRVNDDVVNSPEHAIQLLLTGRRKSDWGKPLRVRVRRGLPHPYTSHPRLDLFVGSLSPHKMADFACTICHEGQGSATTLKWASHTPNTPEQKKRWAKEYGWFDNPHWIFPMYPKRFLEASCLKCHHEVTELRPSERFPEPPAPKVVRGYDLIRKYGCYACHEINGYDKPDERVGPDLRLEPNFFAAALQLKHAEGTGHDKLTEQEQGWLEELVHHPDRTDVRRQISKLIAADERLALLHQDGKSDQAPRLSSYVHKTLGPLFKDVESPGNMRRPGPSLRFVAEKLDEEFLLDWIAEPARFRPSTRMPQFFGLTEHLKHGIHEQAEDTAKKLIPLLGDNEKAQKLAEEVVNHPHDDQPRLELHHQLVMSGEDTAPEVLALAAGLVDDSERFERVEVLAVATYLLESSQPFEQVERPEGIQQSMTDEMVARGKVLFETRGCLACHNHKDYPGVEGFRPPGEIVQGPDLSGVGMKFAHDKGRDWLYSWLKNPNRYHARTLMPDTKLEPIETKDAEGKVTRTDPAADITEFLLASASDWKAREENLTRDELNQDKTALKTLDQLVLQNLKEGFSDHVSRKYLEKGIGEEMRGELKGAEIELVGDKIDTRMKLLYIGRKTIGRYGCFSCHDIPGFEDAKPIGTGLADWGRKDPSKLAFEHISHYLGLEEKERNQQDLDFFEEALLAGHRAGFIYQKLREPRSYDYHKTANKGYNERLRMPEFNLDDADREAVVTFVLGLVADPPSEKFIPDPDTRQLALIQGKQVLDRYNCASCHVLNYESWNITHTAGQFDPAGEIETFPFMKARLSPDVLAASHAPDRHGRLHSKLVGMLDIAAADGLPELRDEEGESLIEDELYDPANLEFYLELYQAAAMDGQTRDVASRPLLLIPTSTIQSRRLATGGALAKYLVPRVVDMQKKAKPGETVKGKEAWEYVPPALVGEGEKVQSGWLHDFLLDPHEIRPKAVLRMPQFNMSPEEATKLVNYFAAIDNVDYPYHFKGRTRVEHLANAEQQYQEQLLKMAEGPKSGTRFEHAMKIVLDKKNGCTQCHMVGDFQEDPSGPNLALVYKRLRPEYVRQWIARPKSFLPYTSMPENVKYNPGQPDDGFKVKYIHGDSTQQLDSLVDLLMNFDEYMLQRSSIKEMVDKVTPAEGAGGESEEAAEP